MREGSYLGLSTGGFHRLAYTEWGPADAARTVVCWHGLTRNGRDFDALAERLAAAGNRVVCPDAVGRGRSDWLADPAGYGYPQMAADAAALIARLDVAAVDWVGTSMGGLVGLMLAAQPKTPLRRLAINDVGPFVPKAALQRIAAYLGQDLHFADVAAAEAHLRQVHAPFGALSDAQWQHLTRHSLRPDGAGGYRFRYDPGIARAFVGPFEDLDLWSLWDAIAIPVLVLRGAESDLLRADTAAEMAQRGPKAEVVEIAGCGHAPALLDDEQVSLVEDWLSA